MHNRSRLDSRLTTTGALFLFLFALAGCSEFLNETLEDENTVSGTGPGDGGFDQVIVQGNVGDGPVANSSIIVTTVDGATIWEGPSEGDADYSATMLVLPEDYPLYISASGGTDLVTGSAPYLTMESSIADQGVSVTNLNPFSTIILESAKRQASGVSRATVDSATDVVVRQLNFGLDLDDFRDPTKTPVQPSNIATVVRSGVALSEMFRRASIVLTTAGLALSPDVVLSDVAGDLTDGVLDGRPTAISTRVAGTANLISGQIALEALTNTLTVDGMDAMNSIDTAILTVRPNATTIVGGLTATPELIAQSKIAVAAAYDFAPSTDLANLLVALDNVPAGASITTARQRLPQNPGSLLDAAIDKIWSATANDIERINSRVRSGLVPDLNDTVAPVISLLGPNTLQLVIGDAYVEYGATAADDRDGNISGQIRIDSSNVNSSQAGNYTVTYDVSDAAGNAAEQVARTVSISAAPVIDTEPPVISINGDNPLNLTVGDSYVEQGATAIDNIDGNISGRIAINNSAVTTTTAGNYQVTYNVSDAAGNRANEVIRAVAVTSPAATDNVKPVLTLVGPGTVQLNVGDTYVEQGATATDNVDGDITARISISNSNVNTNAAGSYSVRYNVSDTAGNAANEVTRTVSVTSVGGGGASGRQWEAILSEATGYARNITGGQGGQLITVTNLNGTGSGSLRAALGVSGRTWIRFSPGLTGTINLSSNLKPNSNTTIDGRGANITLDWGGGSGYGIYMTNTSNIIIMYLRLQNAGNDLIHFRNGFSNGWVHHVTFGQSIDELLSIRNGADIVTISWCRMNANTRGALLRISGASEAQWSNVYSHVTMHHNYWTSGIAWRSPKMANVGHYHIYNDYNAGDSLVHAIDNAEVLVENTIFEPNANNERKLATTQDGQADGKSKAVGNLLLKNARLDTLHSSEVFTPPYSYAPDPATLSTRDQIIDGAGWQSVPFPE